MRAALGALFLALVLAGCAAKTATVPLSSRSAMARPAAGSAAVSYGVILVERPVPLDPGTGAATAGDGNIRASILAALGGGSGDPSAGAADGAVEGGATEYIVRIDDGRMISVVQSSMDKFKPGERVMIIHGPETRLAPETQS